MLNGSITPHDRSAAFHIFAVFASLYFLTCSGTSFLHVNQTDVGFLRLEVAKSVVERLDVDVPSGMGMTGVDGRDYSWFGAGSVLVSLPCYVLGKALGFPPAGLVSLMNPLCGAATAALVFLFSIRLGYSRRASVLVSIFYGLGTMAWYYAKDPGDHVLETFFVLLSLFGMQRYRAAGKNMFLVVSGASFGIAFLTRGNSILAIPALLLLFGARHITRDDPLGKAGFMVRDSALFSCAVLPFVCIFFFYNYYRFGSVFESGYTLMADRLGITLFSGTPVATGLAGLLASPGKGFFFYSPVALLFFVSIGSFWKKHAALATAFVITTALYVLFYAKYRYWHGDWAWGPRYLLAITPFLLIPVAELFDNGRSIRGSTVKKAACVLLFLGVLVQLAAVSVSARSYFHYLYSDLKIPFTVARGTGVPSINEPPPETYFNWRLSPLPVQAKMAYAMGAALLNNKAGPVAAETGGRDLTERNILDFWWIHMYSVDGSRAGFLLALLITVHLVFSAIRLRAIAMT